MLRYGACAAATEPKMTLATAPENAISRHGRYGASARRSRPVPIGPKSSWMRRLWPHMLACSKRCAPTARPTMARCIAGSNGARAGSAPKTRAPPAAAIETTASTARRGLWISSAWRIVAVTA